MSLFLSILIAEYQLRSHSALQGDWLPTIRRKRYQLTLAFPEPTKFVSETAKKSAVARVRLEASSHPWGTRDPGRRMGRFKAFERSSTRAKTIAIAISLPSQFYFAIYCGIAVTPTNVGNSG